MLSRKAVPILRVMPVTLSLNGPFIGWRHPPSLDISGGDTINVEDPEALSEGRVRRDRDRIRPDRRSHRLPSDRRSDGSGCLAAEHLLHDQLDAEQRSSGLGLVFPAVTAG